MTNTSYEWYTAWLYIFTQVPTCPLVLPLVCMEYTVRGECSVANIEKDEVEYYNIICLETFASEHAKEEALKMSLYFILAPSCIIFYLTSMRNCYH